MAMPFVFITSYLALEALQIKDELPGWMQRFAEKLSLFNYNI